MYEDHSSPIVTHDAVLVFTLDLKHHWIYSFVHVAESHLAELLGVDMATVSRVLAIRYIRLVFVYLLALRRQNR